VPRNGFSASLHDHTADATIGSLILSFMSAIPSEFPNVTAIAKANIYFDGKVVSHSIVLLDGSKKTLGIIYPGSYHFGTDQAEIMEIVAGSCEVKLDGTETTTTYTSGQSFNVPAKSGFDIAVTEGLCEYICSFVS
jgi:purine/pyrimidine-nucleoside phosphorylase